MKKSRLFLFAAIFMNVSLIVGCGTKDAPASESSPAEIVTVTTAAGTTESVPGEAAAETAESSSGEAAAGTTESVSGETAAETAESSSGETAAETAESVSGEAAAGFSFADVANREFYFSSGAGAWYTVLHIHEDGTFDGHYQDADMGVADAQYPNGTLYYSDFSGSFTKPKQIDDNTVSFQIVSIEYPYGFGDEIRDGYHYIYENAYGLYRAEDLYLYLPGSKTADLPQAYKNWVGYYLGDSDELPFYGLYNVKEECGFSSFEVESASDRINAVLSNAEEQAAEVTQRLQHAQSQTDLNTVSYELYETWDNALNTIWNILKETLDEEAMKALTAEERSWIDQKMAAIQEATAEYTGGSIVPFVANQTAADWTEKRVYELAERYGT